MDFETPELWVPSYLCQFVLAFESGEILDCLALVGYLGDTVALMQIFLS